MKNVIVENNGVDIAGSKGQQVEAVFDGTVVTVSQIPGHQNMVMIQHDSYFTVYTKLAVVNVEPGDKVNAQEVIGSVYTNDKNQSTLHFEIWKGKKKENPSQWLKL
jgi:murein DD-endopeptidase MepM/ murein hydrolase activator NlpD